MKIRHGVFVTLALAGCTYGAPGAPGTNTPAPAAGTTVIDVSLTSHPATAVPAGSAGGFAPATITVPAGTLVRFVNTDSFAHTASSVGTGPAFPAASPLGAAAQSPAGNALSSAGWSSGNLNAGTSSAAFVADKPGVYLYGCFYHYGAPMRGEIVVQ